MCIRDSIIGAVKRGIDMFDCVLPTRSGRTGLAFTWQGRINIKNKKYQNDNTPLDKNCNNLNLNKYSKNYLTMRHLLNYHHHAFHRHIRTSSWPHHKPKCLVKVLSNHSQNADESAGVAVCY